MSRGAAFLFERGGLSEQRGWAPRSPRETTKCSERGRWRSRASEAQGERCAKNLFLWKVARHHVAEAANGPDSIGTELASKGMHEYLERIRADVRFHAVDRSLDGFATDDLSVTLHQHAQQREFATGQVDAALLVSHFERAQVERKAT